MHAESDDWGRGLFGAYLIVAKDFHYQRSRTSWPNKKLLWCARVCLKGIRTCHKGVLSLTKSAKSAPQLNDVEFRVLEGPGSAGIILVHFGWRTTRKLFRLPPVQLDPPARTAASP
jgi:hypothetical protein